MSPTVTLVVYCVLILLASLLGGWIPLVIRLSHRRLELAVSLVSGVMLGMGVLHLLPHALMARAKWLETQGAHVHMDHEVLEPVLLWLLLGFLVIFVLERFFCFHHHDAPDDGDAEGHGHGHGHGHAHGLRWSGAALGLTLHSLIAGMALAATISAEQAEGSGAPLLGFATFLIIVLHKPFDSLTLGTLMAAGRHSRGLRHLVNALFSLVIPAGAALFLVGLRGDGPTDHLVVSTALAFSTGTFLCIALSDLLPELQFHSHDRIKLTVAMVLGVLLAWGVSRLEAAGHDHSHAARTEPPAATAAMDRPLTCFSRPLSSIPVMPSTRSTIIAGIIPTPR
jgi:zinc and cadmium transporter